MKTIQIPLELAEELMKDILLDAAIFQNWSKEPKNIQEYLPDSYHQLKKLVDGRVEPSPNVLAKNYPLVECFWELNYLSEKFAYVASEKNWYENESGEWFKTTKEKIVESMS